MLLFLLLLLLFNHIIQTLTVVDDRSILVACSVAAAELNSAVVDQTRAVVEFLRWEHSTVVVVVVVVLLLLLLSMKSDGWRYRTVTV